MLPSIAVVGLAFGDEGKGGCVDHLVRQYPTPPPVVRFNGACQAAHNVVTDDGRHHTFSQWGSGTFAGSETHLNAKMLVNPLNMILEADHLRSVGIEDPFSNLYVSQRCPIITPYHVAANRAREIARGENRHGSCGEGVGETVYDLRARKVGVSYLTDLQPQDLHPIRDQKLSDIEALGLDDLSGVPMYVFDEPVERLCERYRAIPVQRGASGSHEAVVYEGAQGILLDQTLGFHPYTTWSDTTTRHAGTIHSTAPDGPRPLTTVGVLRTYMTRHGAGPFPTEHNVAEWKEDHNDTNAWQGNFRTGFLDLPLLKYSTRNIGKIDYLAVTHMDALMAETPVCIGYNTPTEGFQETVYYERGTPANGQKVNTTGTKMLWECEPVYDTWSRDDFIANLERELRIPVCLESWGPTSQDKVQRIVLP